MLFWYELISNFRFRGSPCFVLELLIKRNFIEKRPRIIELVIPRPLQISHRLYEGIDLGVTDERDNRGVYACAMRIVGLVVVALDSAERFGRLA